MNAVLLLAVGVATAFWAFRQIEETVEARQHIQDVTSLAGELASAIVGAETGQRGFLLTGDEAFLEPYLAVRDRVGRQLADLRHLTRIDDAQQRLAAVAPLLDAKMTELARIIELRRTGDTAAVVAAVGSGQGKRLMDAIRTELTGFVDIENIAFARREALFLRAMRRLFAGIVVVSVLALLSAIAFAFLIYRETQHRLHELVHQETQHLLAAAAQLAAIVASSDDAIVGKDLTGVVTSWNAGAENNFGYTAHEMIGQSIARLIPTERLPEEVSILARIKGGESLRHFETVRRHKSGRLIDVSVTVSPIKDASGKIIGASKIARDISERKVADQVQRAGEARLESERREAGARIQQLNAELEQRVIERTAELETANKELESFSYSVSHDLRTPVRAIDGFSQAVLEDFGPLLPEEGRRYLQAIRDSAGHMGALIDDLLAFAQLKRQELNKRPLDTGELVRETLAVLGAPWPDRQISLSLSRLPDSCADRPLLRQVWINLLSNALKYTGKRDQAVIEIGCVEVGGADAFFVRDNGIGFDMRHADKLFTVFQRFHRAEDYEGTGVGLAIVQRIIQRHGGRAWADAAVDRGATFYFTLQPETKS